MCARTSTDAMRAAVLALVLSALPAIALPAVALAGDPAGLWERSNGKARFRIEPCGADLCAIIVWIRPDVKKGKVGQTVFRTRTRTGDNSWTGEAFDAENGSTYKGTIRLEGDRLHVRGCALGLFCKSDTWKRIS
jgi:uncharacterized protein (DUF2147 family)